MEGVALLNASEASRYLGCSRPTFYKRHQAHLTAYKPGGQGIWLYKLDEVAERKKFVLVRSAA